MRKMKLIIAKKKCVISLIFNQFTAKMDLHFFLFCSPCIFFIRFNDLIKLDWRKITKKKHNIENDKSGDRNFLTY